VPPYAKMLIGLYHSHDGVRDFHATLLHLLGIGHERLTFRFIQRSQRLANSVFRRAGMPLRWVKRSFLEEEFVEKGRRL
jgi:hypothetical protein